MMLHVLAQMFFLIIIVFAISVMVTTFMGDD
jgi:hypothetical protein